MTYSTPLSAGQRESIGCHNCSPVVESMTQLRLSQCESEHRPQQQWSPMCLYLQSFASRFVHGLPGEARLHSGVIALQLTLHPAIAPVKSVLNIRLTLLLKLLTLAGREEPKLCWPP